MALHFQRLQPSEQMLYKAVLTNTLLNVNLDVAVQLVNSTYCVLYCILVNYPC